MSFLASLSALERPSIPPGTYTSLIKKYLNTIDSDARHSVINLESKVDELKADTAALLS